MRYVTVRLIPAEGSAFHPLGQAIADDPTITRGALHRVELLDDGTGVMLASDRGDEDRYREILSASAYVRDFAVTSGDGWWYSYIHFEPNETVRRMTLARRDSAYIVEPPVDIKPDGSQILTLLGDDAAFVELTGADSPDYEVELLETGQRRPDATDPFACLTQRQREILEAALDLGYYHNPREATHEDIADRVGATPSVVGEHLRKVEARVFDQYE